jgi:hypothetical protein
VDGRESQAAAVIRSFMATIAGTRGGNYGRFKRGSYWGGGNHWGFHGAGEGGGGIHSMVTREEEEAALGRSGEGGRKAGWAEQAGGWLG